MLKNLAAALSVLVLSACAGTPDEAGTAPPPPATLRGPAAEPAPGAPQAQVAAPNVSAPAPTPAPAPQDGSIVVPGAPEQPIPAPPGDPRSVAERVEDVRAWDQCVTRVQAAFETDPMRPQLETPEDVCSRSLGMASRLAIPESRRR